MSRRRRSSYASSKLRIGLLAALLGAALFTGVSWAQETGQGAGAGPVKSTLTGVILGQKDPIFFIIAILAYVLVK